MARTWTEEEKKAFGEKMKAARAKKATEQTEDKASSTNVTEPTSVEEVQTPTESTDDLKRQIEELKQAFASMQNQAQPQQQVGMSQQGNLIGTFEKYIVDPAHYPDPTARLAKESRLAPFAFEHNYDLVYSVSTTQYETKDGRNVKEPRFYMELRRVVLDDAGVPTEKRYIVRKLMFHEDPQAAIVIAREQGLNVDESNQKQFLDEMRYLRARDWLLDIFYPKQATPQEKFSEEVIGGKLVQVVSVNSEETSKIPFGQLNNKL